MIREGRSSGHCDGNLRLRNQKWGRVSEMMTKKRSWEMQRERRRRRGGREERLQSKVCEKSRSLKRGPKSILSGG